MRFVRLLAVLALVVVAFGRITGMVSASSTCTFEDHAYTATITGSGTINGTPGNDVIEGSPARDIISWQWWK